MKKINENYRRSSLVLKTYKKYVIIFNINKRKEDAGMTREELSAELGVSENRILRHWREVCNSYERIGIKLIKRGKGENAEYGILKKDETVARF